MDDNNRNYNEITTSLNTFSVVIAIIGLFINYSLFIAMTISFVITIVTIIAVLPKDIDINNIGIFNNLEESGQILAAIISTALAMFVWLTIIIYNLLDKIA